MTAATASAFDSDPNLRPQSVVVEGIPAALPRRSVAADYDLVAADYARLLERELERKPLDRALLTTFSELVDRRSPVLDLGCGPGRIAGFLHALGCTVIGFDLSREMVAQARLRHPEVTFGIGSLAALPVEDASVGGVVAWYSIIHTPTAELPRVFAEFARVLRPGGQLLLAFQVGDNISELHRAYGHDVRLHVWRRSLATITELLHSNGFTVGISVERAPDSDEAGPRGYIAAELGG